MLGLCQRPDRLFPAQRTGQPGAQARGLGLQGIGFGAQGGGHGAQPVLPVRRQRHVGAVAARWRGAGLAQQPGGPDAPGPLPGQTRGQAALIGRAPRRDHRAQPRGPARHRPIPSADRSRWRARIRSAKTMAAATAL